MLACWTAQGNEGSLLLPQIDLRGAGAHQPPPTHRESAETLFLALKMLCFNLEQWRGFCPQFESKNPRSVAADVPAKYAEFHVLGLQPSAPAGGSTPPPQFFKFATAEEKARWERAVAGAAKSPAAGQGGVDGPGSFLQRLAKVSPGTAYKHPQYRMSLSCCALRLSISAQLMLYCGCCCQAV